MNSESIDCTNCHAPLALLGNVKRCRQLICQYCGTVMDCRDNFKALYTLRHIRSDKDVISIGASLRFSDVLFDVVGYIAYADSIDEYLHYQLYSPTHGYAQLVHKSGVFIFLRRTFYLPDPNVWLLKKGDVFTVKDQQFTLKLYAHAQVYYAAGHIIDRIKPGQRHKHCFAQRDDRWFYSLYRANALENYQGYEVCI